MQAALDAEAAELDEPQPCYGRPPALAVHYGQGGGSDGSLDSLESPGAGGLNSVRAFK